MEAFTPPFAKPLKFKIMKEIERTGAKIVKKSEFCDCGDKYEKITQQSPHHKTHKTNF